MAVVTTLSQSITNADTVPPVFNTAGEGAQAPLLHINDIVTVAATDSIGSTYKLVRLPTGAHVKAVTLYSVGCTTMTADIDVMFSDAPSDGTPTNLGGTIPQIAAANNKLFGAAESMAALPRTDVTHANATNYPLGSTNQPLWAVLGYASDPGGLFDIVLSTVVAPTVAGTVAAHVDYCVPGAG